MKGIAFVFFATATICALLGMGWGIHMSASGDHTMAPAHAHLNLLGWVTLALFGLFYHLVPQAAEGLLAKIHLGLALLGVITIVPGIYLAIGQQGEALAKIGSVLSILSMLVFVIVVFTRGRAR
ncbi:hypothetical protein KM176_08900 [Pseudooceanicola sp. CBS1P-1]|uniref:Uncharacterized protein n=1 Tax=Pseudooceanicola albus TaxID=2692189 RepID=A0A6L7FZC7_9RHOB|nr:MULTISPECIES: hypothetical protein [Pseudooceanicola]MBT9383972.1 hypothetical protein [Pseudooceanicola endophyticus]MXN16616.1 hypothetical protein [Pseudooceanicola albus]